MAFNHLVEADCGGSNALMRLTSHISTQQNLPESLRNQNKNIIPLKQEQTIFNSSSQTLIKEFLELREERMKLAPSSFNMQSLLEELKQQQLLTHQPPQPQQLQTKQQQVNLLTHDWVGEYTNRSETIKSETPNQWSNEFLESKNNYEYLISLKDNFHNSVLEDDKNFENIFQESKLSKEKKENWFEEFSEKDKNIEIENKKEKKELEGEGGGIWSMLQNKWDELNRIEEADDWEQQFWNLNENDTYRQYIFESNNPLVSMETQEALEKGKERLEEGDVANAILYLESVVQQQPLNPTGWFYLGMSQADNEQEHLAIAAFNKCLELEPENLKALLSLAVGYTNEGVYFKAYEALSKWICFNPNYKEILKSNNIKYVPNQYKNQSELMQLFMKAIQLNKKVIDPDLQVCLGVLFNLSGDYDKAVDCFTTALHLNPKDSMLWNKLGATLANGQKSELSLEAYKRALSLRPGYVRTRFNLGVACVNLGAYKEAVEHFVSALQLQQQNKSRYYETIYNTKLDISEDLSISEIPSNLSENSFFSNGIWSSLRMSLALLGRRDLLHYCDNNQLPLLIQALK